MASAEEMIRGKKYRLWAELGKLPNGRRDRRSKVVKASGKREAKKLAQDFEDDLIERLGLDEDMFFSILADKWLKNYAEDELEITTYEKYVASLEYIIEHFESYRTKEIKPLSIIEFFKNEKKEGRGSLDSKYKVLKSIFDHAVTWKVIKKEDNPMADTEKPKEDKKQENKDFYRTHEIPTMLELITEQQTEEQQLMVLLALTGALRRGEVAGIASDVCNFKNNSIFIKRSLQQSKSEGLRLKATKTEDTRTVFIPEKVMKRLHALYIKNLNLKMETGNLWSGFKDVNGKEVMLLFSNKLGKPYRPDSITQFWNRFAIRNEEALRRIRFHDLRHSSATYILSEGTKKGLNMRTVQKRLGHKDIETTLRLYSHVSEKDDEEAGDLFNALL